MYYPNRTPLKSYKYSLGYYVRAGPDLWFYNSNSSNRHFTLINECFRNDSSQNKSSLSTDVD